MTQRQQSIGEQAEALGNKAADTILDWTDKIGSYLTGESSDGNQANLKLVKEYMTISYDPVKASGENVKHLVAPNSRMVAPTTFPDSKTLLDYADDHKKVMVSVNDLKIVKYDVFFASGDKVCLRYTAEGSHNGEPHNGIPATGKKATWTASAIFEIEKGKLKTFYKDWDKLNMWTQLGWPIEECIEKQ
ncbi:ATP synthase subunit delta [Acrasis kona]|uniref:ATP synthase subunit delta n=1 Tax=Acrasis kona TaxID=1008807 RepID=A0AAW2YMS4_9EUKA